MNKWSVVCLQLLIFEYKRSSVIWWWFGHSVCFRCCWNFNWFILSIVIIRPLLIKSIGIWANRIIVNDCTYQCPSPYVTSKMQLWKRDNEEDSCHQLCSPAGNVHNTPKNVYDRPYLSATKAHSALKFKKKLSKIIIKENGKTYKLMFFH